MAYEKPTFQEIYDAVKNDLFARFPTTLDPTLRESMAEVIVGVISTGLNGNYFYTEWASDQVFVDTADTESVERHGSNSGLYRFPAQKSSGSVTFTGEIGSIVPTGSELATQGGLIYEVVAGFTLASTSEEHTVISKEFGSEYNLVASDVLTLTTVFEGMDSSAVVFADFTGGRDRETDAEYTLRIQEKMQAPGRGGSVSDYIAWIKESVGATRVWIRTFENGSTYGETIDKGTVRGYFAIDDVYVDGIPSAGDVTTCQTDVDVLKPAGSEFVAIAPIASTVDFDIQITPFSTELETAVTTALTEMITQYGIVGGTITTATINNTIGSVTGITNYVINDPVGDVSVAAGELHTVGTITVTTI